MFPKNIIHITHSLNIGGLEVLLLEFLKRIDREKYNPIVCTFSKNGTLIREFQDIGIPVKIVEKRNGIDYTLSMRLATIFKKNKIDLIHTHNIAAWLYATIAKVIARVPHIVHTEHSNVPSDNKRLFIVEKYLARYTDTIIADSERVAEHLIDRQGIPSEKVVIILNGIDIEKYQVRIDISKKKEEIGLNQHDLVIGIVARLVPVKNHMCLLKAFSLLRKRLENIKLVIVGDGELRGDLERYVRDNELSKEVFFLGSRRDIPELLKIFDLFVLPSHSEGLSITLIEAMASGIPIVATDVGGNREVIGNNEAGILIPPDSVESLFKAMMVILTHRDRAEKMGRVGIQRARSLFSLSQMTRKYEQIYENLLFNSYEY